MSATDPVVIVGAGPAGVSAARALVEAGRKPILVDEGMFPGGQIFRPAPAPLGRSDKDLYGFEARRAKALRDHFTAILPSISYCPETLVWGIEPGILHLARKDKTLRQPWTRLIVAPGAMDRIVPIKGWTGPGVFTLGGAQIALKAQASLIGRNVVFVGTGPLLYLVAYQYARAGARVVGVLESADPFRRLSSIAGLAGGGRTFAKGLYYMAWLRARGVVVENCAEPTEILRNRNGQVSGVRFLKGSRERTLTCDAVGMGYGLKSETQLADLLGVSFEFDRQHRQWLPTTDSGGRSSIAGIYFAGDGLAIRGSEVAELTGELAALALLSDDGHLAAGRAAALRRRVARMDRFRRALDEVFPLPCAMASSAPDDAVICRCEGLTAGGVRKAVTASGEYDINRIKAFTRLGMGRCQGRVCAPAAAELIAAQAAVDIAAVGRIRGQLPVKPVTLSILAGDVHDQL